MIYSLVGTCKANSPDPFAYFRDVIDLLPRGEDTIRLHPAEWKAEQLSKAKTQSAPNQA